MTKHLDKGNLKKRGSFGPTLQGAFHHGGEVTHQEIQGTGHIASLWSRSREWWMLELSQRLGLLTPLTDYPQVTTQIDPHKLDSSKVAQLLLENNSTP